MARRPSQSQEAVDDWCRTNLVVSDGVELERSHVYTTYVADVQRGGGLPTGNSSFGSSLRRVFPQMELRRGHRNNWYTNIAWAPNAPQQPEAQPLPPNASESSQPSPPQAHQGE